MTFRWTAKRDRDLAEARMDGFSFRDAAGLVGAGCTAADAKARMKVLLAKVGMTIAEIPEREVRYGSQGPLHPVIGPDHAEHSSPPATAEGEVDSVQVPPPQPCSHPAGTAESTAEEPGTTDTIERLPMQPTPEGRSDTSKQAPGRQVAMAQRDMINPARRLSMAAHHKIQADSSYFLGKGIVLPSEFYERAAIACLGPEALA